jgi:hypothetical protein
VTENGPRASEGWWNNEWDPEAAQAARESVRWRHGTLRVGDRVLLSPSGRADIFDIALRGRSATIESIEVDFEDKVHLAVTVDDDPGRDLGAMRQPGHRFFFTPDDVEPLDVPTAERTDG